jgi:hypothetical protein
VATVLKGELIVRLEACKSRDGGIEGLEVKKVDWKGEGGEQIGNFGVVNLGFSPPHGLHVGLLLGAEFEVSG